jgi:hypothetical protein
MTIQVDIDELNMMGYTSGWTPIAIGIDHDVFVDAYGWVLLNNGLVITEKINLN